uniref:Uncharacterized protein n=1 Tax=Rhizophora mucronata TaxID=61149 RepID=A0A2P2NMC0_RHIMU
MIKQDNPNWPPVIRIYHAGTHINRVLPCESRSRGNTSICSLGYSDAQICGDECFASSRHLSPCRTGEIIARRERRGSRGQNSLLGEPLHSEERRGQLGDSVNAVLVKLGDLWRRLLDLKTVAVVFRLRWL